VCRSSQVRSICSKHWPSGPAFAIRFLFVHLTCFIMSRTLRANSLWKLVTSRSDLFVINSPSPKAFPSIPMNSIATPNPSIGRLQQFPKHFSTTPANMSQTNQNFLLSEVFNVKGKVCCSPVPGSNLPC
jgi:hypothetical protein